MWLSHCGSFDRFFENVATTLKKTVGIIVRFFQGAFSLLFLADQIGLLFDEFISIGAKVTTSVSTVRSGPVLVRSLTVLTFSVLMTGLCTRS